MLKKLFMLALLATCSAQAQPKATLSDYMPERQKKFVQIVGDYAEKYQAADNQLKKSAVWKERTKKLRETLTAKPNEKKGGWVGAIDSMGTTSSGKAWVVIRISPGITISTWNNELSDIGDKTLIQNGSATYNALAELQPGAVVYFDCNLKPDGQAFLEETKMLEPNFLARFASIKPMPGATVSK